MESKRSKLILIGLTVICILLIGITSINTSWLTPLRTGVGYILIPIQSGVNAVGSSVYNQLRDYSKLNSALIENNELKEEISGLKEENNRLQSEQYELARLRELYQLDQDYMQYEKVGARVIAKDSGNWFQVFRINKGSADGIQVDMNVVAGGESGGGLVGIVTDVGANYATVRSIIDDSSRVSAMAMQSGAPCIAGGNLHLYKEGRLNLTNIDKDDDVKDGDKIITSNISPKFLPGIMIGYAKDITVDSNNLTKSGYLIPVANFDNLQEVLIITQLKETGAGEGES